MSSIAPSADDSAMPQQARPLVPPSEEVATGEGLEPTLDALGPSMLRALGVGLGSGLVLGIVYRGFMRLLATNPAFSWSGTLGIIGVVTVMALLVSIAGRARSLQGRSWVRGLLRVLAVVAFVPVLGGQGMVTAPTVLLGGLAVGRTSWSRWVRVPMAALAVAGLGFMPFLFRSDLRELGVVRSTAAIIVYLGVLVALTRLFAVPTATTESRWAAFPRMGRSARP